MRPAFTRQRIDEVKVTAAAADTARADAVAVSQRAAAAITAVPAVPADRTDLSSELELLERELASAAGITRDTERAMAELLRQRDELRGLLGAYKAKAARLCAAEDPHLAIRGRRL
jgi:hypothetical protein